MRTRLALLAALLSLSSVPALAARTSLKPGSIAKDAIQKRTGVKVDHTMEIGSVRYRELVMGWTGAVRGPGARGVFMVLVDNWGSHRNLSVDRAKVSQDLEKAGKRRLAAHLREFGLPTGKIELGDHVTAGRGGELLQRPFSRDSGFLRFTVTQPNGKQQRYLVPTLPEEFMRGARRVLGQPFMDKDTYGQTPQR